MVEITPELVSGKKVLLRYDIDVALHPLEEFKLRAGLSTLKLCLQHAQSVILMGHVGRPSFAEATAGKPDKFFVSRYSVAPIVEWFRQSGLNSHLTSGKLKVLENLRFDPREEACDLGYAKELASMGDFYVNEAFSSYRPAVSTTILPTLLPHAAGLHFSKEVEKLTEIRENPKKPFVAIMGGAKVADKQPVVEELAKKADAVLVGGKLVYEIKEQNLSLPKNVMVGMLSETGFDITAQTVQSWERLITGAKMIVWNGPLGKIDNGQWTIDNLGSAKSTFEVAKMVLDSQAEIVVGGGDTIAFLNAAGLLERLQSRGFVSVGGGAMLEFLSKGTLPTIEVLT